MTKEDTTNHDNGKSRTRRALRITGLIALALALPFAAMIYLRTTRGDSLRDLGQVEPFVVKDRNGTYFDHTQLMKHVTVVALFPSDCKKPDQPADCLSMQRVTDETTGWLEEQLAASGGKKKNPVQLLVVAPSDLEISSNWRVFDRESFGSGTSDSQKQEFSAQNQIIPGSIEMASAGIYVIDPALHFRGRYLLDQNGSINWDEFKIAMSRMTMNLYFNDYLSKRTFFGPVKEKPTPSPP